MVEAQLDELSVRTGTPGYFSSIQSRDSISNSDSPQEYPSATFHDSSGPATPTAHPNVLNRIDREPGATHDSMHGDASERMSESSKPDRSKAGTPSNRRRSRPQSGNSHRLSAQHTSQAPSSHGYVISSPSPSENVPNHPPSAFQGSPMVYSPPVPYGQRPGYAGQYTMPSQPGHMTMGHPPSPYYPHSYHPTMPDGSNINTIHAANFPSMLQPQAHVSHPFPGTRTSSMYPPHRINTPSSSSPSSSHPPSSSGQNTPYITSGPFQSLPYPAPTYSYHPQGFPSSPMYGGQYPASPFGQHYTPPNEGEPQGTWVFLPHPPQSPQQFDAGGYTTHYSVAYPQVGHPGAEVAHGGQVPSSIPTHSPPLHFPFSPSQHIPDSHTPSDSPGPSGAGPPMQQSYPSAAQSVSSGSGRHPASDKPRVRRPYHPNPPAHRSEWVMWAGNVPSDASHDELWRFFNQPPEPRADGADAKTGVLSIFLISRSSCAFINYETEAYLHQAIARFNGVPLRSNDPRCPRLVCRERKKDDDLKAGVGLQRGRNMHLNWIRDQKGKAPEWASDPSDLSASISDGMSTSPASVSERLASAVSSISMADKESEGRPIHTKHSSSSGSYASTTSSFLARYFPKRYFILKSLTQEDLDLSVQRGVWATQRHNEEILDQAFRTSKEVHLIFSVNKSGEFYGHARMSGPVLRGETRISWASRPSQQPPIRAMTTPHLPTTPVTNIISPSDGRFVDESPLQVEGVTPGLPPTRPLRNPQSHLRHSAPPLLGEGYKLPTVTTLDTMYSLDQPRRPHQEEAFELDRYAPLRALRGQQGSSGSSSGSGSGSDGQDKSSGKAGGSSLDAVEEVEERVEEVDYAFGAGYSEARGPPEGADSGEVAEGDPDTGAGGGGGKQRGEEAWGDSFAVEWICTDRLPFYRTKHLRNPWNHDREIKVSRDGTEVEPTVGQRLLDEWDKLADPQLPPTMGAGKPATSGGGGKKATGARPSPAQMSSEEGTKTAPRSR
ncbi:YTH domain-containing protein 1 [Psilocybe cubensis]|uniref:YTH domain-containing protein n=2 Tax=Psilocybe cubensis TaxID=181762 RepID=A0A8H8CHM7_PSICU|nr:YTH domain-containing protein 1 [Psilocybe cubensis]KAH9480757.1 YTH domain-containing protein 1 [Psilocybe cubensis]